MGGAVVRWQLTLKGQGANVVGLEENTTCVLLFAELFGPPAKNKISFLLPPIRGNDCLPANFLRLLGLSRGD